jgi:hypothetical protein
VGGLNGQESPQTARVRLSFLGGAEPWWVTTIRDGASDREFDSSTRKVTSHDEVEIAMRPRGGFVLRLTPD